MKKIFPLILLLILIASCGTKKNTTKNNTTEFIKIDTTKKITFNKLLKSNDYELKYKFAKEYYADEKYLKASDLLEQIVPYYRGQSIGDEVYFLYAMCNFKTGDYLYAGYHFNSFYDMYPNSNYSEEALFLSAYCNFLESPRWSLDQEPTEEAITRFQIFLSKFPESNLVDSCNFLIDTLRYKLEQKSYGSAKLYYDLGYFNAADIALNNSLKDYPDTYFYEDILFHIIKSNYEYAEGSISYKQKERYIYTVQNCDKYLDLYPEGKYLKEIVKISEQSQKNISKYNN